MPKPPSSSTDAEPAADASPKVDAGGPADAVNNAVAAPRDLGALVRTHQQTLWRYARYLGATASEADDLVQETFLAVHRSAFVERCDAQTAGYLRTIARRQLLMLRRRQSRRVKTVEIHAADAAWGEAFDGHERSGGDLWDDRVDAARRCVEELDGRVRTAIDLMYRESSGREAIAAALEMTSDGVKTLLRRTRAKLRECIERRLASG